MNALQELVEMKNNYQAQLKAKGEEAITDVFNNVLSAYPNLESIEITGYVPYFNDGDACVFNMYDPRLVYKNEEYDGRWDVTYKRNNDEITEDEATELNAIFDTIGELYALEDAFESIFGEHFRITATRDGVEVEEYTDHD